MARTARGLVASGLDFLEVPLFLALVAGGLPTSARAQEYEQTVARFRALAEAELARGVASVSAAFVHRDSVLWAGAHGLANAWSGSPATAETVYSTASTFKSVTATAVLILAQDGGVDLDDPVNSYLGDLRIPPHPDATEEITLRHLLTHRAGLPASAETVDLWERRAPPSLERIVSTLTPVDPPGSRYRYSNPGICVAALVVERVSGLDFESFVLEEVFEPLGIEQHALFGLTPAMAERLALPYLPYELAERLGLVSGGTPGNPVPMPQVRFGVYPAGDAYATPRDMARFLGLHLNHGEWRGTRILDPSIVAEAHSPQSEVGSEDGLGWFLVPRDGRIFIEHSGGFIGYSAYLIGDPGSGFGVYVAANAMGDMTQLAVDLVSTLIAENHAGTSP